MLLFLQFQEMKGYNFLILVSKSTLRLKGAKKGFFIFYLNFETNNLN
jgi:hypothetical protein